MVFMKNCYCQGKSLDWRLVLLSGTTPPSAFHSTQGFFCIGRRCCRFASIAYKHTSSTRLATLHGSANEFNTEQYLLDYVHIVSGKNSAARFMHLFRIWQTATLSPCFQAAIIFLFHARSDNQITRRQGINNLTHFIRLLKAKEASESIGLSGYWSHCLQSLLFRYHIWNQLYRHSYHLWSRKDAIISNSSLTFSSIGRNPFYPCITH